MKPLADLMLIAVLLLGANGAVASTSPEQCEASPAGLERRSTDEALQQARVLVEAARGAVESLDDSQARLERAEDAVARMPAGPERLDLRLHVLRTRQLWCERECPEMSEPNRSARRVALAKAFATLGSEASSSGADDVAGFAALYRARIYAEVERFDEALALLDPVLRSAARSESLAGSELLARAHSQRGSWLAQQGDAQASLAAHREARRTLARLRTTMSAGRFLEVARPMQLDLAHRLLEASRSAEGADREALLREAVVALEDLKSAELRDYFGDPCLASLRETPPDALPGTVVLMPVLFESTVELLVLRGGRIDRFSSPLDRDAVDTAARSLRRQLQDVTTPRYRRASETLYDALVRPIPARWLEDASAFLFVPMGSLRGFPPSALRDALADEFLVEKLPVATLVSLRLPEPSPIDRRRANLLVAGLTESVAGFAALPSASDEMAAVAATFPSELRVDEAFTMKGFSDQFDARPFDIVHIASHARVEADANESFLLAHDGRLTLPRLAELVGRTRARTSRPLELITLSACETAVGDDRAALGLAGVAVQSGARSALATLWRVDDAAAAQLVARFYRELADPDTSRGEALRRAQRALLEDARFRHPAHWSAFLLINSWL